VLAGTLRLGEKISLRREWWHGAGQGKVVLNGIPKAQAVSRKAEAKAGFNRTWGSVEARPSLPLSGVLA